MNPGMLPPELLNAILKLLLQAGQKNYNPAGSMMQTGEQNYAQGPATMGVPTAPGAPGLQDPRQQAMQGKMQGPMGSMASFVNPGDVLSGLLAGRG